MTDPKTLRILLDYNPETGALTWKNRTSNMFVTEAHATRWNTRYAGKRALTADNGRGYRKGKILGVAYRAHRVAWAMYYGKWPQIIDHENGVKDDNRIVNLRSVTNSVNLKNAAMYGTNTSGHVGVYWNKDSCKWVSQIGHNSKLVYLGRFKNKSDAINARKAAEVEYGYHPTHGRAEVDAGSGH
jgi:hypothetical protein